MTLVETLSLLRSEVLDWCSTEKGPRRRNLVTSLLHLLVEATVRSKEILTVYEELDDTSDPPA